MESMTETDRSLRETPQRWWLAILLVLAMISCYAQRGALSVAAPFMIKDLSLSPSVMGVLLSAFFWTYSFMQMPAGWLVDRFGVRRGYALGYAFWSIASSLTGFAKGLIPLMALRMFVGIGQAVAFPASARAVANWFHDKERGTVSACYLIGVRLGQATVGAIGAYFLSHYGLKIFFLVIGIAPMLWLIPWVQFLKPWENVPAPVRSSVASSPTPQSFSFVESLKLFKQRSVSGIFWGFFAYDYAWYVYVTWLPGYLVMERKFSAKEMGIYSSVPFIAMSFIILLSGLMSDWLIRRGHREIGVRKLFIFLGLLVGCLIVPAGMVENKTTAVWLLTISLCGLGIATPNTWTLTQAVCAKNIVGTVSGIQNFGGNVGGIIAPALTGYIAHVTHSFALALSITGGILVFGILAYTLFVSRKVTIEGSSH